MSTRATYQISYADNYRNTSIYIYCHHDNYPTGAATRFKDTLELRKRLKKKYLNNDFLECFIAANTKNTFVEITDSHDTHWDTDYSYDIVITDAIYLKAYIHYFVNSQEFHTEKSLYYEGLLIDFIKMELSEENIKKAEEQEERIRQLEIITSLAKPR
jgi:hypothetical protein